MIDRTTKAALIAIAVGIWIHAAISALSMLTLGAIQNDLSLVPRWIINGGGMGQK